MNNRTRRKNLSQKLETIQDEIRNLRDGELNPCHGENDSEPCSCYLFDQVIDLLENLKRIV
jgi:hypothetical protein